MEEIKPLLVPVTTLDDFSRTEVMIILNQFIAKMVEAQMTSFRQLTNVLSGTDGNKSIKMNALIHMFLNTLVCVDLNMIILTQEKLKSQYACNEEYDMIDIYKQLFQTNVDYFRNRGHDESTH
jgi:hypothetical protein